MVMSSEAAKVVNKKAEAKMEQRIKESLIDIFRISCPPLLEKNRKISYL